MPIEVETSSLRKPKRLRAKFRALLDKTNKEHPQPKDVAALADLLNGNKAGTVARCIERRTIC